VIFTGAAILIFYRKSAASVGFVLDCSCLKKCAMTKEKHAPTNWKKYIKRRKNVQHQMKKVHQQMQSVQ
jgi:hypothetical protein